MTVSGRQSNRMIRLLPFLAWLPSLNRGTIRGDLVAGLTGAIVVLPQGVAFATIAGMPPEYGLYAGMIPAIIAALFGSSLHLVSGPTTAASIVQEAFARLEDEHPQQKHLAVVAQGINFVDVAGGEVLGREAQKRKARGGALYLIHVKAGLWEPMERCGCLEAVGPNNVFQSKTAAITGIYQHLDKSVCAGCDKRIFRECGPAPA